jgi:hypothetical protein
MAFDELTKSFVVAAMCPADGDFIAWLHPVVRLD